MELKTLDIRPVSPREKHPTIFTTFDTLKDGEAFQLINDHDPKPLYYQFNAERPNQFKWETVEEGPEVWRVNIFKISE
ncbi:MAG TPA: hemerythrin [Ignavibacteriales bacterium]|nr:hemerythrin [Ignavibacteriales bacterium]